MIVLLNIASLNKIIGLVNEAKTAEAAIRDINNSYTEDGREHVSIVPNNINLLINNEVNVII
ncbi:hypothetical protein [Sodalis endosymbiont of Henestaris halophilus]|uniref:hypothetical protein n=1 Tax=Sodalis endosymbiont of Henestaris halophilus TaxID=1929246 RepID=UPI0012FD1614|nr:hypothetical protein [Sodalis endosymbiont of Henestaris halophilus]